MRQATIFSFCFISENSTTRSISDTKLFTSDIISPHDVRQLSVFASGKIAFAYTNRNSACTCVNFSKTEYFPFSLTSLLARFKTHKMIYNMVLLCLQPTQSHNSECDRKNNTQNMLVRDLCLTLHA